MPSVQGLTFEAAVAQLRASGFNNVTREYQDVYDPMQVGKVISQSPSASSSSFIGITTTYDTSTTVTLIVGKAAE